MPTVRVLLQTFINNLIRGWPIKTKGDAFAAGGKTSPELFKQNPASMRLETEPIIDKGSNKGLIISIQVMGYRWCGYEQFTANASGAVTLCPRISPPRAATCPRVTAYACNSP